MDSSIEATTPDQTQQAPQKTAPAPGGVHRCLCFEVEFSKIKSIADSTGGGLLEAHRRTGCGARCGLCLPYIQVMLKTGQTDLPVMWAEEFRRHGVNPGRIQQIQASLARARTAMQRQA